jgi:hypothetical protein
VSQLRLPSRSRRQGLGFRFDGPHKVLDGVDFLLLEIRLATLLANPGWDGIQRKVATFAVNVQRRCGPPHFALTMDALHRFALARKSYHPVRPHHLPQCVGQEQHFPLRRRANLTENLKVFVHLCMLPGSRPIGNRF